MSFLGFLLILPSSVLIFGAQDTTASALSRLLYMLSMHPEMQERVREEVKSAIANSPDQDGRLSYDEVTRLPLLDAVIKETLRL
jgi:cytochrome P450